MSVCVCAEKSCTQTLPPLGIGRLVSDDIMDIVYRRYRNADRHSREEFALDLPLDHPRFAHWESLLALPRLTMAGVLDQSFSPVML